MQSRNEWDIQFRKNVHMYCHRLVAAKADRRYEIPCEDTPDGFVGIWLCDIGLESPLQQDLVAVLLKWAESSGLACRIYETRDSYVSSETRTGGDGGVALADKRC
jgi:hypothetical protein